MTLLILTKHVKGAKGPSITENNKRIKTYRDLIVWQKSILLTKRIYMITECFPRREHYGLADQLRRSSVSIASNIAELAEEVERMLGKLIQRLHK